MRDLSRIEMVNRRFRSIGRLVGPSARRMGDGCGRARIRIGCEDLIPSSSWGQLADIAATSREFSVEKLRKYLSKVMRLLAFRRLDKA